MQLSSDKDDLKDKGIHDRFLDELEKFLVVLLLVFPSYEVNT
jgi:hypothetical protein